MSDELDKLRVAMRAATPKATPDKKSVDLSLAHKNFETLQGSTPDARLTSDRRPNGGLISGVVKMLQSLSSRGALTATTALVAVGIFFVIPQTRNILTPPGAIPSQTETNAPVTPALPAPEELIKRDREFREATGISEELGGAVVALSEAEIIADESQSATARTDQGIDLARIQNAEAAVSAGLAAPAPQATMPALKQETEYYEPPNTETFANEPASQLKITANEPVSTFSIDVDTASYAVIRSSLMAGYLPPPDAVRIEEMINYFPYDYPIPDTGGAPFSQTVSVVATPWNPDTQLVHIALQGQMPALENRPPLNLVFLIDTSGSMQDPDKLPLLKQSFKLMLGQLRPTDQVAIVTYAGSAGQVLAPTAASERSTILAALENLRAGGSTAGQAGLQQAYSVAEAMSEANEVTRVILATDGDFNVGISNPDALKDFIADKRDTGTYLSVLGFGRGNLDDTTMQALAQNGNGTAAYIDTLNEAQKVLVDQLSGALFPIAGDVKIQVEFNPALVAEYRLIGYETRALAREDFNNDKVDAGDIGAGHSVTALYEITPVGSPAVLNEPLRYQTDPVSGDISDELGFLRLRYKNPGESKSQLIETPINSTDAAAGSEARFAIAMAGFGQLLRSSDYLGDWSWDEAIELAGASLGKDAFGYRREAINLMRLAKSLTAQ